MDSAVLTDHQRPQGFTIIARHGVLRVQRVADGVRAILCCEEQPIGTSPPPDQPSWCSSCDLVLQVSHDQQVAGNATIALFDHCKLKGIYNHTISVTFGLDLFLR